MKKTIITVFAFMILFGFAVSGAMAQTTPWTWETPWKIINKVGENPVVFDEFVVTENVLYGCVAGSCQTLITETASTTTSTLDDGELDLNNIVDSVAVPPFAVIDENTVGALFGANYIALVEQPTIPVEGVFSHVASGSDGKLYVILNGTDGAQYVLIGTSDIIWDVATVRFTPRSLNLGSNGNWVTCKISGLTGHTWDEVSLASLCIVGINDTLIATPICVDTTGPSNTKNSKKLMVKFNRKALADAIQAQIDDPDLSVDPTSTKITVAHSDGTLNFYGEDTIKTKPVKEKKHKKK